MLNGFILVLIRVKIFFAFFIIEKVFLLGSGLYLAFVSFIDVFLPNVSKTLCRAVVSLRFFFNSFLSAFGDYWFGTIYEWVVAKWMPIDFKVVILVL